MKVLVPGSSAFLCAPVILSKIKQKEFSFFDSPDLQDLFMASRSAIARVQRHAIKRHGTAHHLCPDIAARLEGKT
jgi:hypothetical protein